MYGLVEPACQGQCSQGEDQKTSRVKHCAVPYPPTRRRPWLCLHGGTPKLAHRKRQKQYTYATTPSCIWYGNYEVCSMVTRERCTNLTQGATWSQGEWVVFFDLAPYVMRSATLPARISSGLLRNHCDSICLMQIHLRCGSIHPFGDCAQILPSCDIEPLYMAWKCSVILLTFSCCTAHAQSGRRQHAA